ISAREFFKQLRSSCFGIPGDNGFMVWKSSIALRTVATQPANPSADITTKLDAGALPKTRARFAEASDSAASWISAVVHPVRERISAKVRPLDEAFVRARRISSLFPR